MIVCSCNLITRRQIEDVIERLLRDDPYAVLTPGLLYHRMSKRGRCCGCFPQVVRILVEYGTEIRERILAEAGDERAFEVEEVIEEAEVIYLKAVSAA